MKGIWWDLPDWYTSTFCSGLIGRLRSERFVRGWHGLGVWGGLKSKRSNSTSPKLNWNRFARASEKVINSLSRSTSLPTASEPRRLNQDSTESTLTIDWHVPLPLLTPSPFPSFLSPLFLLLSLLRPISNPRTINRMAAVPPAIYKACYSGVPVYEVNSSPFPSPSLSASFSPQLTIHIRERVRCPVKE